MTAEAFLDEELPSAEAFLDAAEPAPSMSAEAFLDTPLDEEPPAAEPVPTPFEERPTGMVALDPVPQAKPSPLPSPAEEQTASLSRDALADANAKRGIFSPDSAPYRLIGEQFAIDPLRYDEAAGALWKDGLIDSDQYYRMMNDAAEIKPAAQRRRALETQAGTNPELKAALYGLTKGAIQTAGAIGVGGAAGAGLAATGPGAIVGGIAAGTGTAMVLGDMVDTFAEKLAQENDTIASLLAAKELYPGYDTAGQLASVVIPAPYAVSKLKTAASLIATERGAGEAAKFVARVTGTGAGIGAATDLAVQGGMAGVNLATGNPVDFSMESLAVSTALGGLTAGLGVRSQNKIYKPEELVGLERRALDGTASFEEFRDYSTMRAAVETLRKDDRLLSADAVRRATADFMGTPALDVTEIINPRFQQQALADAGLVLPYAAAPTAAPVAGAPVAYTGQAFLDRGGPAPAFQGGTNALPGPEGIPALPGPLPETPVASVKESLPVPAPAPLPEPPTALAAPSRLYLNVPFNRKEAAKSVGAKFDPDKKLWYLPRQASGEFAPISQGFVPTAFDSSRSPKDLEAARINAEAEFGRPVEIASAKISSGTTAYALKFKGGDWLNKAINFEIEREQARVKNNFSGGGTVPATMESQPSATAPLPESPTESTLLEAPIVEYPVADLKLSKDVPNFKENADPQTGVVKGEALQGKVDRRGMAPIVAWRRLNGQVEVISGRHRLDLFRRNQVGTIPTQIFNEADGFSIQDALTLDAELNIRDGQGTIKDYADYFRNSDIGEQQATQRGLLSRQKGISGFAIGKGGSDDLYAAFSAGKLSESKAAAIALAAPGDAEMQRVGMQFAKELSAPELTSFIAVNRRAKQPGAKQGDLFGNSDDNLNAAVALVKASRKRIGELDNQILSVKGAVKRPEAARKMGVDVNDPEAIRSRMVELEAQKEKYIRFFDHPEILSEVRALAFGEAAPIKPPTIATNGEGNLIAEGEMPFNLTSEPEPAPVAIEPVDEEAARRAAIRKAGEENTMSLFDAGPLPAAKSKGKSSGYADAGPLPAPAPAAASAAKPDMATYSDAQIYADYPEAVGVVRTKGPGWTMPLILGGTDKVPVMEMPEIVEFYRSLVGQDPSVRNLRSLGLFNPASGNVSIRPDIFQNEQSALMTLAHEIGHVVSWMDERDIRLGNLGGHIMNVQKFLKAAFPVERGGEMITPQERKKLYAQARNSMPAGDKPEKGDPGRGDWEAEVASRYRELIQELMTERGLAYVGPRRGDFEAGAYDPNIREELIGLSEWWKPIDYDRAPAPYVKYRHSAAELYADAVSVLFNSPADLEQRAPNFWKAFWNYADARPKVKASLFEIQNRIQNGREAVLDKRLERDLASFKAGRETFLRKHNAAQERRRSLTGWWESFKDQYWNRYQPLIESAAKARAAGKITPAEEDAYRWLTEEHPLADGKLQLHLADIGRLYQKLDEAGISRDLLGLSLKYHRIANERLDVMQEIDGEMVKVGETGRAVMANPGGETSRTATEMLAKLRASMSPEQAAALDETLEGFRAVVFSVMEDANASGMFSPQLWETISNNRENYAAFTPLEYVEEYLPSAIKKQIGTFKEIADPLQQTVLKMISIHRAAQNNRFKRGVADMLREVAPELITDAPMKYNGKAMVPQPPRDSDLALLQWKDGGQLHGVHIPKRYAAMFEDKSPAERDAILRFLATGFQRAVYGAIIRYNPAFQLFMSPARDLQRSLTNMPGGVKGRAKFLANLFNPEAWGASVDWARGDIGRSALLREMVENAAVGGPHSAFGGKLQGDDDALVAILRKFHIQDQPARNALLRAVMKPLHAIEFAGQVLQLLPKAAAYKVMVKDTGMPAPQAANTIRNHIGIPNYYKKGRNVTSAGALVPFLNIFLRSYESLYRNLSGKERNMGGKEWWIAWALTGGGLYAVMQTLAREGVFGEDLQRLYSRVPNWDMTNFGIVPLGEVSTGDTGGKTVYLRLPQDEGLRVINGTVAKLLQSGLRTAQGDPTAPKLGEVFDGISSQVPGVNPVVEVAQNWTTFLAGRNPRDNFRNKNILTEDQWLAGGWDAAKPMLGWTLGATGITNFFNYDPEADTFTEMAISSTPVLNRLLKISDRGVYQNEKAVDQASARDMAKARLTLPDFVQGLRTEFNYLKGRGERRSEREEERYSELLLWNRSYREAMEEVETSMELGNRPAARDAIQTLIQESRDYRSAN